MSPAQYGVIGVLLVVLVLTLLRIFIVLAALRATLSQFSSLTSLFQRSSDILNTRAATAEGQLSEQRDLIRSLTVSIADEVARTQMVAFLQEQLAAHQVALVDATQRANANLLSLLAGKNGAVVPPRPVRSPDDGFRTSPTPESPTDPIEYPPSPEPLAPDHRSPKIESRASRVPFTPPIYDEQEDLAAEKLIFGDLEPPVDGGEG